MGADGTGSLPWPLGVQGLHSSSTGNRHSSSESTCSVLCWASQAQAPWLPQWCKDPKEGSKKSLLITWSFIKGQKIILSCPQIINRLRKKVGTQYLSAYRQNSASFRIFLYLLAALPYTSVLQTSWEVQEKNTPCLKFLCFLWEQA